MGFEQQPAEQRVVAPLHRAHRRGDAQSFAGDVQKTVTLVGIGEPPAGHFLEFPEGPPFDRLPIGGKAEPPQGRSSRRAPRVVLLAYTGGLLRGREAVGDQKAPVIRHGNRPHRQRIEPDQRSATGSGCQRSGVVHAAAAGPDEMLALRQDLHELLKSRGDAVGAKQGQGERYDQRRGRRQAGGGRKVGHDGRVDAAPRSPFAADRLRGGPQVVLPIACRDRRECRSPFELARAVAAGARGADAMVDARTEGHTDAPAEGDRENRESMIIDVLADQVHPAGSADASDLCAGSEGLLQQFTRVWKEGHHGRSDHDSGSLALVSSRGRRSSRLPASRPIEATARTSAGRPSGLR